MGHLYNDKTGFQTFFTYKKKYRIPSKTSVYDFDLVVEHDAFPFYGKHFCQVILKSLDG
jgi:hypothetical protein